MQSQSRIAQTSKVEETAAKILSLRRLTAETGFRTGRSQNDLLAPLNADELAAVAAILTDHSEGVNRG